MPATEFKNSERFSQNPPGERSLPGVVRGRARGSEEARARSASASLREASPQASPAVGRDLRGRHGSKLRRFSRTVSACSSGLPENRLDPSVRPNDKRAPLRSHVALAFFALLDPDPVGLDDFLPLVTDQRI